MIHNTPMDNTSFYLLDKTFLYPGQIINRNRSNGIGMNSISQGHNMSMTSILLEVILVGT